MKYQQDGEVERFKARLVAKGFSQRPGQDYVDGETYSPVFSYTSLRTIVSKAANDDYQLDCWDLASSFVQLGGIHKQLLKKNTNYSESLLSVRKTNTEKKKIVLVSFG